MTAPVRWNGSDLVVDFGTGVQVDVVEGVLDLDDSGQPIGLEVLGILVAHPGLMSTGGDQLGFPQVSVDAEADAIYIRFSHGRSLDQVVRLVAIAFDRSDRIVGAVVRMEL
jgi:hypothetical protein